MIRKGSFTIRPLEKSEWQNLRDFRLRALQTAPEFFCSSYAVEKQNTPEEWQDWLSQNRKCVFGLFKDNTMIGLTGIFTDRNDPSGATAVLASSFLDPAYRGQGLSHLFYEARLQWATAQPFIKKVVVSHRKDNEASRRANQSFGFHMTTQRPREWPDGTREDEVFYELEMEDLRKILARKNSAHDYNF